MVPEFARDFGSDGEDDLTDGDEGAFPRGVRAPVVVKRLLYGVENLTRTCQVAAVEGVDGADVSFEPPRAVVSFDPTRATVADLMAATAAAGYPTRPATDA